MASIDPEMDSRNAIESVVRDSYGRLIAFLAVRTRDVAGAEDALGDALLAALQSWPHCGVPEAPEAWLATTARRKLIDKWRHQAIEMKHSLELYLRENSDRKESGHSKFADDRLPLLFVCAHPAINRAAHAPLMLQTVLGVSTERIASSFLVSTTSMYQRLVRAKAKIRDAGIAFEIPESSRYSERLDSVLDAIYATYGTGWDAPSEAAESKASFATDAIGLARMLAGILPDSPETLGLLSLMLYCESRRSARFVDDEFVPLSEQETDRWSRPLIREAAGLLSTAAKHLQPGRFQLEAAIQSVHIERARTGVTNWAAIVNFYNQLVAISPTIGARVGQGVATAELLSPQAGIAILDELEPGKVKNYQPYWAARAHLFARQERNIESMECFEQAIALSKDEATRRYLNKRLALLLARPT